MGYENEVIKKNYYVNIGANQGVKKGNILDVYRNISRLDAYQTEKMHRYDVKIGELKVLHTEEEIAIAKKSKLDLDANSLMFEIDDLMIGDTIKVNVTAKKED